MRVRIRLQLGPRALGCEDGFRSVAAGISVLMGPLALTAAVLGVWRISADMGMASKFAIDDGPFSHWQVWFAVAAAIQACAVLLDRYGSNVRSKAYSEESETFFDQRYL